MSNVAKLKKKAAELEQKKQFDKALQVYVQILEEIEGSAEEGDVALFNRVGDLMLRAGNVAQAVDYYEKAVDLYAEGGFFNNAIALCNKILRNSPGRTSIYYKLGKISAKKGFTSDAKQNFLEYADRMQKAGRMDESFRALKEFADLCPDQDDIRLMLADQLSKRNRKTEALEQLQTLYDRFSAEGRTSEARATAERMKSLDPAVEPKAAPTQGKQKSSELVFLDVDYGEQSKKPAAPPPRGIPPRRGPTPPRGIPPRPQPTAGLPLLDDGPLTDTAASTPEPERAGGLTGDPNVPALDGLTTGSGFDMGGAGMDPAAGNGSLLGLEPSGFGDAGLGGGGGLLELEPTGLSDFTLGEATEESVQTPEHDLALPGELPMLEMPGMETAIGGDLPLVMPDDPPSLLGDLEPPIARDGDAPYFGGADYDLGIQKEDSAFMGLDGSLTETPSLGGDLPMIDVGESVSAAAAPPPATPAPASAARSESALARSAHQLRDMVQQDQENWALRRQYAESLLEAGERDGGLHELEMAMIGFERAADLESARTVADEIIRLNPNSVRHHQKRVEYAFRTNDKPRLVEAYLELADSLFRSGQPDKAKSVYQRVLELAPDDIRAQAALSAFVEPAPARRDKGKEPAPERSGVFRRYTGGEPAKKPPAPTLPALPLPQKVTPPPPARAAAAAPPAPAGGGSSADFVNLKDWLKDEQAPKSTRMVVAEQAPTGDEQADFADMLRRFKAGIAENVDDEDHESHYDLGVAYKEMGLLDEAIAEFQKALRAPEHRVRAYEALGQCFLEKGQFQVAATILARAEGERGVNDDQLVGVLYLLGYANEGLQKWADALRYYERVFAVDIQFRDVGDRIAALERVVR